MIFIILDEAEKENLLKQVRDVRQYLESGSGKEAFIGIHPAGTIAAFLSRAAVREYNALPLLRYARKKGEGVQVVETISNLVEASTELRRTLDKALIETQPCQPAS